MFRKFISYYKSHRTLFILDMSCAVVTSVLAILIPVLTRSLIGKYLLSGNSRKIVITLILMMGIYIIKTILTFIRVKWGHILGVRMEADMRRDLFSHIQKLSFSYFDRVKTGHLMSRIS
ncbi:MAG: ABC transporter ATP-binding protein, partial [Spirochaetales bacterium]|nr:ABC transporter ATP-binding protein [Spirochaetales bacterium]